MKISSLLGKGTEVARSKLNLRLVVEGVREDGYHLLSMLNIETSLADRLSLEITQKTTRTVSVSGPAGGQLSRDESSDVEINLAGRAAARFFAMFGIEYGFSVHVDKRIPIQSGLGGGSSDAAAVLRYLSTRLKESGNWSEEDQEKLESIAISLGADVPYFLRGGLALVKGVGEKVTPLPHTLQPNTPCVIVKPQQGIETKHLFRHYARKFRAPKLSGDSSLGLAIADGPLSYEKVLGLIKNDLLEAVADLQPDVGAIFNALRAGSLVVGLTGSGSAMFALAKSRAADEPSLIEQVELLTQALPVTLYPALLFSGEENVQVVGPMSPPLRNRLP